MRHSAFDSAVALAALLIASSAGCRSGGRDSSEESPAPVPAPSARTVTGPALAAPCGVPTVSAAEWREDKQLEGLTFRVPPRFTGTPSEPWRARFRTMDAELTVWTWAGKSWVFPLLKSGRSNRCTPTVGGREVLIEVVELDPEDAPRRRTGPRTPVYQATATWRDDERGRWVYAQLRSPLRRDMEMFPTIVSSVSF